VNLPAVDFTWAPTSSLAPQAVAFTAQASADTGIASYSWNFGESPTGSGPNPSHTYNLAGTYLVKLTVTANTTGAVNSVTKSVVIGGLVPPVGFTNTRAQAQAIGIWPFSSGHSASFTYTWFGVPRAAGDTIAYQIHVKNAGTSLLCQGIGQTVDRTITVASSGGEGAFQSYTDQWSGSIFGSFVCKGNYSYEARTVRTVAGNPTPKYSAWSASKIATAS
jgi:PKD repeat protein